MYAQWKADQAHEQALQTETEGAGDWTPTVFQCALCQSTFGSCSDLNQHCADSHSAHSNFGIGMQAQGATEIVLEVPAGSEAAAAQVIAAAAAASSGVGDGDNEGAGQDGQFVIVYEGGGGDVK